MKTIIVSATFLAWTLLCGWIAFDGSSDLPVPRHGYNTEDVSYEPPCPERPLIVALDAQLRSSPTRLRFDETEILEHDGIQFRGSLDVLRQDVEVVFLQLDFFRRRNRITQFLNSQEVACEVGHDGRFPINVELAFPDCEGEVSVALTAIPIASDGQLAVPKPKAIAEGLIQLRATP